MPGVLLKCFLTKNISTCANKRIPRKALKRKFFLSSGKNINSFLLFVLTLIEREMLFVRRARRWGLEKPICKTECHDDAKTIFVKVICFRIIMVVLFYALFFTIPFVCTLLKAPGLPWAFKRNAKYFKMCDISILYTCLESKRF